MLCAPWKAAKPEFVYAAKGCLECRNTGYMGRMGIYETMIMTPNLQKMILPDTDLEGLREVAFREGMKPLRISGAMKVAAGLTTIEEIVKVAPPIGGDRRKAR
jgi:general secretion pathway protein E